jgi:hypothetical protein
MHLRLPTRESERSEEQEQGIKDAQSGEEGKGRKGKERKGKERK